VRIFAQLLDSSGRQVWSDRFDAPAERLLEVQDEIVTQVASRLVGKIESAWLHMARRKPLASLEVYDCWLRGMDCLRRGTPQTDSEARVFFERALSLDPSYARGYAGISLSHFNEWSCQAWEFWDDRESLAFKNAKQAAALDDRDALIQLVLGRILLYRRQFDEASRHVDRAIELNPNYAEAHDALCVSLTYQKRFDDAVAECKKAQELDPSSSIVTTDLGVAYAFARRPDEAIEMFRRAHEMDPSLFVPLGYLGFAQTLKGQYTEAIATFRKAIEVSDGSPNAKSHLAYALARAGHRDESLKLVDELKRQAAHEHIASFHFAVPYIGLGNKDEAFFWLGKGVDE